jgi:hypothetical protein
MAKASKGTVSGKRSSSVKGSTSVKQSRSTAAKTTAHAIDAQAIAMRAYELFLSRGAGHGDDWADWLAAERELAEAPREPMAKAADYSGQEA